MLTDPFVRWVKRKIMGEEKNYLSSKLYLNFKLKIAAFKANF